MSEQEEFEAKFKQLTPTQVRVLEQLVVGRSDEEIAANCRIQESTVRKYIQNICDTLDVEKKRGRYRRNSLFTLIAKFKPELINGETPPSSKIEPESQQPSTFDPDFVGRGDAMHDLDNRFNRGTKCILILSPGGQGKTTLAWRYLQSRFSPDDILYFPIAKETKDIASVESLVEERLRNLGEEPGREFMVSLERLREKLTEKPMGVLIDNLEPALDESNRFIAQHRSYVDLFKQVLLSPQVQAVTIITSRAPLHEELDITPYPLKPLDVTAWQAYFEHESIIADRPVLEEMHRFYNGNALAMRVLRYPIGNDYEGDLAAYWADFKSEDGVVIEDPVLNLMQEQFKILERLQTNAYKLLCRMGCYRYQDVSTVPKEGLFCLLWDVPKSEQRRVVKTLKDRALIDFLKGEYRLHPVIRAEALKRLRENEDWEQANRVAAEFWTESINSVETIEDAVKAFEAYYHYLDIKNFEKAGIILTTERNNEWSLEEPVGRSLYRIGQLSKLISSISYIVKRIKSYHCLSSLYNILGDVYWLTGNIDKSIQCHNKSSHKSIQALRSKNENCKEIEEIQTPLEIFEPLAVFNIGLCKMEIWELKEARRLFQDCNLLINTESFPKEYKMSFEIDISFCVAFLDSCFGLKKKAQVSADEICTRIDKINYDAWSKGYSLLFLGLTYKNIGDITKSFNLFNKAIKYSTKSSYIQVKAKALTGIAELYRIENNFSKALPHHHESIQILERIGAKCDLAEAYYQLALTQQKMGNSESEIHFNKAIELWTEIDAPKQIERVCNSIERC